MSLRKRSVIAFVVMSITAIGGLSASICKTTYYKQHNKVIGAFNTEEINNVENEQTELETFTPNSKIVSQNFVNYDVEEIKQELKKVDKTNLAIEEFKRTHVVQEKMAFPLPIKYRNNISSYTGYREEISSVDAGGIEIKSHLHTGIDYACPDKTEVYAVKDGYVTTVYPGYYNGTKWKGDSVYGGLIIIHHFDGTSSLYGHLSLTKVREGTYVSKGENIALSGGVKGRRASGASTGPHLHFSIFPDIEDQFDYAWRAENVKEN